MKKRNILWMPFILAASNSACMSIVMCLVNVGFNSQFWPELLKSFLIGLLVTLPVSYALPLWLNKLFCQPENKNRKK